MDAYDRTPLTDGYIDLYRGPGQHAKGNILGRVRPQVKSSSYRLAREVRKTFSLSREDLQGFRAVGGVLFIHVGMIGTTGESVIRYATLNPFRIDEMLKAMKPKQKSASFRLKPLPTDPAAILTIVEFQWQTQAEASVNGFDEALLKEVQSLTIRSDEPVNYDRPLQLDDPKRSYSILATTKGGLTLPLPLRGELIPASYLEHEIEVEITAGETTFTSAIARQLSPETMQIMPSQALTIELTRQESGELGGRVNLVPQQQLLPRLKDLEFCAALERGERLHLGTMETTITDDLGEPQLPGALEPLRKIHRVLSHFGANLDLVLLDAITAQQYDALLGLFGILFEGEPLPEQYRSLGRVLQPVGEWGLELMNVPNGEDCWKVVSLTEVPASHSIARSIEGTDIRYLVTAYETLNLPEIVRTLNLDLEHLRDAYERIGALENTPELATEMVLKLIGAADSEPRRREEFLNAADDLSDWLLERQPEEAPYVLNHMQIKARRGELSEGDRTRVRAISRTALRAGEDQLQIAVGCAVLLEDPEEVRELLADLSPVRREAFTSWPIAHLLPAQLVGGSEEI